MKVSSEVMEVDSTCLVLYHPLQFTIPSLPALMMTEKGMFSQHSSSLPAHKQLSLQFPQQVLCSN